MNPTEAERADPDFAAHRQTYETFVTIFALIIFAHIVGGSFLFAAFVLGGGIIGGGIVALVEIAVIFSAWRALRRARGEPASLGLTEALK